MKRLTHAVRGLVALVLMVSVVAAIPMSASAKSSAALDARIGGTSKSFQTSFGAPDKTKSGNGIEVYTVKGFGLVAAAFDNGNASQITIAADRLAHTPLTAPDAADWTVTNATKFADALVPTDATYGKPLKSKTQIVLVGHSKTLEAVFTQKDLTKLKVTGVPGDFNVAYNLDTSGNVYSVDIAVGAGKATAASTATATSSNSSSSAPTSANSTTSNSSNANSSNANGPVVHCRDFKTQAEAQAYFDSHGGNSNPSVAGMDGNKDGKPCTSLP